MAIIDWFDVIHHKNYWMKHEWMLKSPFDIKLNHEYQKHP